MIVDAAIERAGELLSDSLGSRLRRGIPMGPMTTYRVGGPAALFVEVASEDDLVAIADARAATGIDVLVIGRGSNMLVADEGFRGLAVSIAEFASAIDIADDDPCVVRAGGGAALPVVARRTAAAGVRGFEWAVGVPGSVGGAVRMNAGGHGSDIAACLIDVLVFDLVTAGRATIALDDLGLRYRASSLHPLHVVVEARLLLRRGDRVAAEAEITEIVRWRRDNQPGGQNCGSVFTNPVPGEITAGRLIDSLGLRGLRIGTAWVSEKHANFVQAGEGGRASDVRAVIEAVRRRVADETGRVMRSEVRLVGFDDVDALSFDEPDACRD